MFKIDFSEIDFKDNSLQFSIEAKSHQEVELLTQLEECERCSRLSGTGRKSIFLLVVKNSPNLLFSIDSPNDRHINSFSIHDCSCKLTRKLCQNENTRVLKIHYTGCRRSEGRYIDKIWFSC